MQPYLRPATNDDRVAVENLIFGVLFEYGLTPDPADTDYDLQDIQGNYHAAGGSFDLLSDASGQVLGTVGLFRLSPTTCELRKMYLVRSARGQGFGRRLLDHALSRATALGFTRMVLETASVLRDAILLYERNGFRPFTPDHLAGRCDIAYYLELNPPNVPDHAPQLTAPPRSCS